MKPVTREFRDEVLAVLLCWWLRADSPTEWAASLWGGPALDASMAAYEMAGKVSAHLKHRQLAEAIATVERWPVLP